MQTFFDDDETIEIIKLTIAIFNRRAEEATSEAARLYWETKSWLKREALALRLFSRMNVFPVGPIQR